VSVVPSQLQLSVDQWRSAGSPPQPGIAWPRDRWIGSFPIHEHHLQELPELLDRQAIRTACLQVGESGDAAEFAFIAAMAWGYGNVGYGPFRTNRILTARSDAAARLATVAATLKEAGAIAAYEKLSNECALRWLGPAFGTKFIYFCPQGPGGPALILDRLVSRWLNREANERLNPATWSSATYRRYLQQVWEWAPTLGCRPDEVELCIFRTMAQEIGGQWSA
jgi:hypothetical protein